MRFERSRKEPACLRIEGILLLLSYRQLKVNSHYIRWILIIGPWRIVTGAWYFLSRLVVVGMLPARPYKDGSAKLFCTSRVDTPISGWTTFLCVDALALVFEDSAKNDLIAIDINRIRIRRFIDCRLQNMCLFCTSLSELLACVISQRHKSDIIRRHNGDYLH